MEPSVKMFDITLPPGTVAAGKKTTQNSYTWAIILVDSPAVSLNFQHPFGQIMNTSIMNG